jgi:YHS domain-containing protein
LTPGSQPSEEKTKKLQTKQLEEHKERQKRLDQLSIVFDGLREIWKPRSTKDQMVEDPIAHVRFSKTAAATTLEWQGQKFYFIGDESCREFEKQQGIAK